MIDEFKPLIQPRLPSDFRLKSINEFAIKSEIGFDLMEFI